MAEETQASEPQVMIRKVIPPNPNMESMHPRSINAISRTERREKTGMTGTGSMDFSFNGSYAGSGNIYKGPSNRFYSPDMTSSSMFLPKDIRNKNLWRRWMAVHDPLIGSVIEYYTEMPWSKAELNIDDPYIAKVYMDAMEDSQFFTRCQNIDQEYLKIGEAIINFNFNENKGYIDYIVIQNPNFIEIKGSPLIGDQPDIFLVPDQELKKLITSTDPRIREKKKSIDRRIVEAVMWGRNIQLPPEYTLHIARRENPTDLRGTSIIDRLFKTFMLEDKIMEGVLATVDNHMFPIKLWKLGDAATHWIPPENHSKALAEMLQQQQFDPNFAIIYHYGIEYQQHGLEGRVMNFDKYFDRIDKLKMLALGVNNAFLTGETTYASASAFLQVMFSRLRSKRDMYEASWMRKFFRIIAEKNQFYKREKREIVGHYRSATQSSELIMPKLQWHKSLSLREDATYLGYLKELFDKGKGPISTSTILAATGLEMKQELSNKKNDRLLELQFGVEAYPKEEKGAGGGGEGGGLFGAFKGKRDKIAVDDAKFLVGQYSDNRDGPKVFTPPEQKESIVSEFSNQPVIADNAYLSIVEQYPISIQTKKAFADIIRVPDFKKPLASIYEDGKIRAYNFTGYLDTKLKLASITGDGNGSFVMDLQDEIMMEDMTLMIEHGFDRKRAAIDAYFMGQIQGYMEQGIEQVCLRYATDNINNGRKIAISDLLSVNRNWGEELYPDLELVSVEPEIVNFDNSFDTDILPGFETIKSGRIILENVPREYKQAVMKLVHILPASIKKLSFVNDITDNDLWKEWRRQKYVEEGFNDPEKDAPLIIGMIQRDRKNNTDRMFIHKDIMYADYTMGVKEGLFENIFAEEMAATAMSNKDVKEAVEHEYAEDTGGADLTIKKQDIDVLASAGMITPINDSNSGKIVGWQVVREAQIEPDMKYTDILKIAQTVKGKWNSEGEPLFQVNNIGSINKFVVNEMKTAMAQGKRSQRLDRMLKSI